MSPHPTGATAVYAVLGRPVQHSGSPALHGRWFHDHGIDAVYVALEVPAGREDRAVDAVRTLGLAGANLTTPLKEAAVPQVDHLTDAARATGAVNTLAWRDGALWGDNTDAAGFVASVSRFGPLAGRRVIVLGSGGAGRAVAAGCAAAGAGAIVLLNRDPRRADAVARALADAFPATAFDAGPLTPLAFATHAPGAALVACAVSGPGAAAVAALDPTALPADAGWCDLNYWMPDPPHRAALGDRFVDGRGMLVHQAALAFRAWTGILPSTDPAEVAP